MSEENRIETNGENCKCFCQSKWFKKFITKTLAVFVGVFCALSLFAALHKPPMPPCPYMPGYMAPPCYHKMHKFHNFYGKKADFHKKMMNKDFKRFEKKNLMGEPPARPERADVVED